MVSLRSKQPLVRLLVGNLDRSDLRRVFLVDVQSASPKTPWSALHVNLIVAIPALKLFSQLSSLLTVNVLYRSRFANRIELRAVNCGRNTTDRLFRFLIGK